MRLLPGKRVPRGRRIRRPRRPRPAQTRSCGDGSRRPKPATGVHNSSQSAGDPPAGTCSWSAIIQAGALASRSRLPMILHVHSQLGEAVRAAARAAFDADLPTVSFQYPPRAELGDLALTAPFDLAKALRKKPR